MTEQICTELIRTISCCRLNKTKCEINGFGKNICENFTVEIKRPDLDTYFLEIADVVSKRSTCLRHNVGTVLVKDKHILTTGYNGAPRKLKHCHEVGCIFNTNNIEFNKNNEPMCRGIHASQNAIIHAGLHGISTEGAILYSTHQPCHSCAKIIINAGIIRVVFKNSYPDKTALNMLNEAKIEIFNHK